MATAEETAATPAAGKAAAPKPATVSPIRTILSLAWSEADTSVKLRLFATLIMVASMSFLTALGPVAMKLVVDGLGDQASLGISVFAVLGLYVLTQLLARTLGSLHGIVYARAERRVSRKLSERLFSHIIRLPLRSHINLESGALNQTLQNGLAGFQTVLKITLFTILPITVQLGTVVIVLLQLDRHAFLGLFCAAIACYAAAFIYCARTITPLAKTASMAAIESSAVMTDSLLNREAVKSLAAEAQLEKRINGTFMRVESTWVHFMWRIAVNGVGIAGIYAAFLAATLLYAAQETMLGHITVGTFILINGYMMQIVGPVEALGGALQGLAQGRGLLDKMLELFRQSPEPMAAPDGKPLTGAGELEVDNIKFYYRNDRPVLENVSFKLQAGKTVGIVGSSGCGKSTLVRLLIRLFEPHSGRILLDGVPIAELPLTKLRQAIAVVPQDTILFNDSIANNIAMGWPGCSQEQIEEAARIAHLHEFVMSLPERYETKVGERGTKLSGGEKQRVAIARAAIKRPLIYIFDEATSSLDSTAEQDILSNIKEISRCTTTVVIAHRLSTIVHADEIVVLENGVIVERGTHAFLLRENGRYAQLWTAQEQTATIAA